MEKKEPKVSIIIPCKNYGRYLKECIDSALAQTTPCEIIVVDDESTDNTKNIVKSYSEQGVKYYYKISNGTAADARNYGLIFSTCEYILPLDADDVLLPKYAKTGFDMLESNPKYDVFAPPAMDHAHGDIQRTSGLVPEIENNNCMLYCSMFRKSLIREIGAYDAGIPHAGWEDWDLWYRAYKAGKKAYVNPEPLWMYRTHRDSMTFESIKPNLVELKLWMHKKHGLNL